MGCSSSKHGLNNVDDSVHVMLKHDRKKQKAKGEVRGYVSRADHPLMKPESNARPIAIEE